MSVRTIKKKASTSVSYPLYFPDQLKNEDGVIYVRQSSPNQTRNNIHSYEMQTDKFIEHFRQMGFTGNITVIPDDEGTSGTLEIHKRPGMMRMFAMIQKRKAKWIGTVHVNRLTRDPDFVTPAHIMKTCRTYGVWIITLRMHFNFDDDYCRRVFMLEAEEAARHLEWMKLILGGGKRVASDKGYYDGRPVPWGYIVDRTDEKKKKYIIYKPHAKIVEKLFKRFFELDGNFPELLREIENDPNELFPPFEPGIDTRGFRRPCRRRGPRRQFAEGYTPSLDGIIGILTNPIYIGWWIPLDGGFIENNHPAIVEEWLFIYAHKRLSAYDLEGSRQKPERVVRNGKTQALLKKVVKGPDGYEIYATRAGRKYKDVYRHGSYAKIERVFEFAFTVELIDSIFLSKFFERLEKWEGCEDWKEDLDQEQEQKEDIKQTIKGLIAEAQEQWDHNMRLLKNAKIPKTEQMEADLASECAKLEKRIAKLKQDLEHAKEKVEPDEEIQYAIYTLLPDLIQAWPQIPFQQKLRFIGSLVRQVTLSRPAPGWAKIEIDWKRIDWDTDIAHVRLRTHGGSWTDEEKELLRNLYSTAPAMDIVRALPTRCWVAIKAMASEMEVRRTKGVASSDGYKDFYHVCYDDVVYAEEHRLVIGDKNPQWSSQRQLFRWRAHILRP
ncbi:hypothetical protein EPA93_18150 [Ktedonosporobacter rubrisoli]|uniref:Resolvase/invertase-type recombinase catalytic domain-containing protein n=1 Tax=Ktedonosporobacter rubrisoli TaxID=2509675 RepID=A0A4V0YYY2_KTERU|nr:hypothetical protein EPA93_18150 [Ktedonosporobacter rubrisoli]